MTDRPEVADAEELRARAEKRLRLHGPARTGELTAVETARLLHELQVHQIELEMQNEELRQARDQVEALLAQYTDLYDFAPIGYASLDRHGSIVRINLTGARLLGTDRSKLAQRRFGLFLAADDRHAFSDFLDHLFGGRTNGRCDVAPAAPQTPDMVLRLEGVCAPDGVLCRVVMQDITVEARADAALRLQSAALHACASAMLITGTDGRISWVNAAFTALTGYSSAEAHGRRPDELLQRALPSPDVAQARASVLRSGNTWQADVVSHRKDGTPYSETLAITPVRNARGIITHCIAVGRDLTEQHQLQAQLLHSQKLETVGRLAGGIAHDFNNLLTVINATADLAQRDLRADDPLREDLHEIEQAGRRAALLTRQLLAFSRKQIMKFEPVAVGSLVLHLQGMLQRLLGEQVELAVDASQSVGTVLADTIQLELVVMNLAVNAHDAMPNGGTLSVNVRDLRLDRATAATLQPSLSGPCVLLEVSDSGSGMDEATRARIFEPFFTTKEPGKGTGLGLSTVYGIVQQSGGSIAVESEPGKGSTFRIYLPRAEAALPSAEPSADIGLPGRCTETLLVVEDQESVRRVAERALQMAGYTVRSVGSGEEALELLEAEDGDIHLLLTDLVMTGIGGVDLAIRATQRRPGLKVLYTSGYANDAALPHGQLHRTASFIGKPYTASQLTRKIRDVLDTELPGAHQSI